MGKVLVPKIVALAAAAAAAAPAELQLFPVTVVVEEARECVRVSGKFNCVLSFPKKSVVYDFYNLSARFNSGAVCV